MNRATTEPVPEETTKDTLQALVKRMQRQQQAIVDLALDRSFVSGTVESASRILTETVARALDAQRVSVWSLSDDGRSLHCEDLFETRVKKHSSGALLDLTQTPHYAEALPKERAIAAHEAQTDPRTREFTESYLEPLGIASMLDATIRVHGKVVGVVCLEHIGEPRRWSQDEIVFAGQVADQMGDVFAYSRRCETEAQLEQAAALLKVAIEQTTSAMVVYDAPSSRIRFANPATFDMLGITRDLLLSATLNEHCRHWELFHGDGKTPFVPEDLPHFRAIEEQRTIENVEMVFTNPSGRRFWTTASASPVLDNSGRTIAGILLVSDVTESKKAELEHARLQEQLLQAQKMESVGRLAGGIAHDFNNLLTGIIGNTSLAMMDMTPDHPLWQTLEDIDNAAESAASLTRQLLAFSRKQLVEPKVLDLNEVIERSSRMLRRLIGEDLDFVFKSKENLGRVRIDPGQVEQVLINLAVNARDAMPDGGRLTLELDNVTLDEEYCRSHAYAIPGEYVMLAVSDDGLGMEPALLSHIFEPFFTTKEPGLGTGLGLSTVFGIVKQNGGSVEVYSELGNGTIFKVYLPRLDGRAEELESHRYDTMPQGNETIVVVEDEEMVRTLATRVLTQLGYRVYAYSDGIEALAALEKLEDDVDLLITDVVMPGMNGKALAEQLTQLRPDLVVLYTSGYTENTIAHHGVLDPGIHFIGKPYTPPALAVKVRDLLDAEDRAG